LHLLTHKTKNTGVELSAGFNLEVQVNFFCIASKSCFQLVLIILTRDIARSYDSFIFNFFIKSHACLPFGPHFAFFKRTFSFSSAVAFQFLLFSVVYICIK
jgi:hypothetical protein